MSNERSSSFNSDIVEYLQPALEQLEKLRLEKLSSYQKRKKLALRWGWSILLITAALDILHRGFPGISAITLLIIYAYVTAPKRTYISSFKKKILPPFFESFGEFTYSLKPHTSKDYLNQFLLLDRYNDVVKEEDHISGNIGEFKMDFREFTLRNKNNKGTALFKGGVVLLITPFQFKGHTLIISQKREWYRKLGIDNLKLELQRVKLENPDFESHFEAFGNDQIDARYILTPAMMEKILQLRQTFSKLTKLSGLNIECRGNKMLFAFEYFGNLIEPADIHTPATEIKSLEVCASQLRLFAQIVSLLNLEYMARHQQAIGNFQSEIA